MLFAANVMLATGISASLMSLGAIDFGLIVDSSVIMIENCVRRLAHEGGTRPKLDIVRDAAIEVRKPTMFGELIIAIVYLPILALQGTEGKLFRPMALTVIFALAGLAAPVADLDAGARRDGLELAAPGEGSLAAPLDQASLPAGARRLHPPSGGRGDPGAGARGRQRAGRLEPGRRVHAPAQRGRPLDRGRANPVGLARRGRGRLDPDREPARRRSPRCGWSTARPAAPRSPTT